MKRGEPLERHTPLRARTPLRQRIERTAATILGRARYTGPSKTVRAQVLLRDRCCLRCGAVSELVYNHRFSGMGGNRAQTVVDGCTLCHWCNVLIEADPNARAEAEAKGWRIRHGADDVALALTKPVEDQAGNRWLLTTDGHRTLVVA